MIFIYAEGGNGTAAVSALFDVIRFFIYFAAQAGMPSAICAGIFPQAAKILRGRS